MADNNGILRGCGCSCAGCAILIVAAMAILTALSPGLVERGREAFENVTSHQELLSSWTGSGPDTPASERFPEAFQVEGKAATLVALDTADRAEVLELDLAGADHALYDYAGKQVEVWALSTTRQAGDDFMDDVSRQVTNIKGGVSSQLELGRLYRFSSSNPEMHGEVWTPGGWSFLFLTTADEGLDGFASTFMRATDQGAAGSPDELPAEDPALAKAEAEASPEE